MSRTKSEQYRIYGPPERRRWVSELGCLIHGTPAENAHTASGGTGRKANADTIVPLCPTCHHELHQHGAKTFEAHWGVDLKASAAWIWQRFSMA